jgi:hypothetical protein
VQSLSGTSPAGLMTLFYCLRLETAPTWRVRSRIYIPQEQGGPVIPPGTGFCSFPLSRNGSWSSLYSFGTDRTENTISSSIVAWRHYCRREAFSTSPPSVGLHLVIRELIYRPLSRNGCSSQVSPSSWKLRRLEQSRVLHWYDCISSLSWPLPGNLNEWSQILPIKILQRRNHTLCIKFIYTPVTRNESTGVQSCVKLPVCLSSVSVSCTSFHPTGLHSVSAPAAVQQGLLVLSFWCVHTWCHTALRIVSTYLNDTLWIL